MALFYLEVLTIDKCTVSVINTMFVMKIIHNLSRDSINIFTWHQFTVAILN